MPLASCPKCATGLRVPDGAGAVRCPKCQTVFQPPKSPPAFEVVDDAPPKPAAPRPAPRPAAKAAADFEVVDDAPKKPAKRVAARVDDDDEDDDRPRKKKRYDDDDEDDRPRSRKRGRDDDEDDDDDRPRKKRRRDDDEDDDWAESQPKRVVGAKPAKSGMLLVSISFWLQLGVFAVLGVFMLVGWLGGFVPFGVNVIPGILGIGATVLATVGFGMCIGGPPKSRPLAIAGTAVAGVHLVLAFVIAINTDAGLFSERGPQRVATLSKFLRIARISESLEKDQTRAQQELKKLEEFGKDNKDDLRTLGYYESRIDADKDKKDEDRDFDLVEAITDSRGGSKGNAPTGIRWVDTATLLPFVDQFLAVASYHNKYFGDYALGLLGGLVELAQFVLAVLLTWSVSKGVRGSGAAGKAKIGLIALGAGVGVAVLVALLVAVTIDGAKKDMKKIDDRANMTPKEYRSKMLGTFSTVVNADGVGRTLIYLLYAGMMVMPAIAALQASSEAARQARRR